MRNLLLLAIMLLSGVGIVNAQAVCQPNPLYVLAGIPGVYPNPVIQPDLASGAQNVAYTETITIMVPQDTTLDLSAIIGFPFPAIQVAVNFQEVTAITGLPTGLNYQCDIANCQWGGGVNGCIKISGTPTQGGNFPIGLTTGYNVNVPQSVPVIGGTTVTVPIPGISWNMSLTSVGVQNPTNSSVWVSSNVPNPFHGTTTISYGVAKASTITFQVTDLTGKVMHQEEVRATTGDNKITFDGSQLAAGIYLYTLNDGMSAASGKLFVQ